MSTTLEHAAKSEVNGVPAEAVVQSMVAQLDVLRTHIRLQAETSARLQSELAETRQERDGYLKALYALTRHERVPFTEEDVRRHEETGRPLQEVLDDVFGSRSAQP